MSAFFFYKSSIYYEKYRQELNTEKNEAQAKASNYNFEDSISVQEYGKFMPKDSVGTSYTYVKGVEFRVVRDASSSIQPKKSRPLTTQPSSDKFGYSDHSSKVDSVNES